MQNKKVIVSIGILAILAVIALATVGVWAVDGGDEIEEPAYEEIVALSAVEPMMNYQGRLLDSSGNPVNGNVNLNFSLYDIPTGGAELWSESKTVQVVNGLFKTNLSNLDVEDFDQALWLEIEVEGETISPRQQLLGAPYAFSLVPGAVVSGSLGRSLLTVNNSWRHGIEGMSYDGDGVRGISYGAGAADNGVYGETNSDNSGEAGVYGRSTSSAAGVYGTSTDGHGVSGNGYYGVSGLGIYYGVIGRGDSAGGNFYSPSYGVISYGDSYGLYGNGEIAGGIFHGSEGDGVRAYSYGSDSSDDGVYAHSSEGRGVYGNSKNNTGVYGFSTNSHGVYGDGGSGYGDYGGYFEGYNGVYGTGYYGVYGDGSYGIYGDGDYYGVYGDGDNAGGYFHSNTGEGVIAESYSPYDYDEGVYAYSQEGRGVYGGSYNNTGVYGYSTNSHGVYGEAPSWGGYGGFFDGWSGVYGEGDYYGVVGIGDYYGVVGIGDYCEGGYFTSDEDDGVYARSYGSDSSDDGVDAYSREGRGVYARSYNRTGVYGYSTYDYGGYFYSPYHSGLYAYGNPIYWAAYFSGDIYVSGNIYKSGSCNFVVDHPTDPNKEIVYVCLEGGETGTYTRGSAQLKNGEATVNLPEHYSLVTSSKGLTVQVTPTAGCNGLYVAKKSNSTIVVKELGSGTSDATFDYLVNGIRIGYEDFQAIQDKKPERRDPGSAPEHIEEEEEPFVPPEAPSISQEPEEKAPVKPPEPSPVQEPEEKAPVTPPEHSPEHRG